MGPRLVHNSSSKGRRWIRDLGSGLGQWSRRRTRSELAQRSGGIVIFFFRLHMLPAHFCRQISFPNRIYSHLIARLEHRALANFLLWQLSLTRRNLTWIVIYLCARMIRLYFLLIHLNLIFTFTATARAPMPCEPLRPLLAPTNPAFF